jgi:hypothetical protein
MSFVDSEWSIVSRPFLKSFWPKTSPSKTMVMFCEKTICTILCQKGWIGFCIWIRKTLKFRIPTGSVDIKLRKTLKPVLYLFLITRFYFKDSSKEIRIASNPNTFFSWWRIVWPPFDPLSNWACSTIHFLSWNKEIWSAEFVLFIIFTYLKRWHRTTCTSMLPPTSNRSCRIWPVSKKSGISWGYL